MILYFNPHFVFLHIWVILYIVLYMNKVGRRIQSSLTELYSVLPQYDCPFVRGVLLLFKVFAKRYPHTVRMNIRHRERRAHYLEASFVFP